MISQTLLWYLLAAFVVFILLFDLFVVEGKAGAAPPFRRSLAATLFYVALAVAFGGWAYVSLGPDLGLQFFAGYIVEQSLSMDNLFVFILIFKSFKVPANLQRRVLFWGVVGAIILRALFIFFGIELLQRIHWMMYVFGAALVFAGLKSFFNKDDEAPEHITRPKFLKGFKRITETFHSHKFLVWQNGKLHATPLLLTLITVEVSDVIFAIDSIPAVLSISKDPFIVYSSNIFAIMGLRSLFFVIADLMTYLRFLNYGLGVILTFVGVKMLIVDYVHIPTGLSLLFIIGVLTATFLGSFLFKEGKKIKLPESAP